MSACGSYVARYQTLAAARCVEIKPTDIASLPSRADASRTDRTNVMSILTWLAFRSWYGEYASVQQLWLFASACEDAGYFEVSHISLLYTLQLVLHEFDVRVVLFTVSRNTSLHVAVSRMCLLKITEKFCRLPQNFAQGPSSMSQ